MFETKTSITLTPRSSYQDAVTKASSTPSPSAVQDFRNTAITNSNASDVVSDAIFEQLGVVVTDSEVIEYSSAVALPELTEAYEYEQTDFENYVNGVENDMVRDGDIFAGDIVREVNDVDLRMPIDMAVWKMTIALMKMAPRPLKIILAGELIDQNAGADAEDVSAESLSTTCNVIEAQTGEDKKYRSATRAFRHLMKRPSVVDTNVSVANRNKGAPPTLEELSEEQLTSIELDQSRDFDECMLTTAQINNLM
eukprot:scaffold9470_cov131-Skeletonema_menzelii.AAC.5